MSDLLEARAKVAAELEALFEELITHQRRRVLDTARLKDAQLTEDDIQQPHDFPVIARDPDFQYEDGLLAGYLAAQMAVRVRLRS
jgi:hypothetical protein